MHLLIAEFRKVSFTRFLFENSALHIILNTETLD